MSTAAIVETVSHGSIFDALPVLSGLALLRTIASNASRLLEPNGTGMEKFVSQGTIVAKWSGKWAIILPEFRGWE